MNDYGINGKKHNNSGFTLVELIVTLTVLAIMAALTTLAVLKWQDWSNFKKENEYAQALYCAAQNQLTEYAGSGYLTEFAESLIKPGAKAADHDTPYYDAEDFIVPVKSVKNLTDSEGAAYDSKGVWKQVDDSGEGVYGTHIAVLKADAGSILGSDASIDLESARKNGKTEDVQAYWVSKLLSSYVADGEVLANAAISIEVAPEDGQVFALLYSDKTGEFRYSENAEESKAFYNAAQRKESYREVFMVGYYGVDTLTKSVYGKSESSALALKNVTLHNDNDLHLSINHRSNAIRVVDTVYDITVYDAEKDTETKEFSIKLDMPSLSGSGFDLTKGRAGAVEVMLPVTRYRVEGKDTEITQDMGKLPFLIWGENNGRETVHIALDSADIQASSWLFEHDYDGVHDDSKTPDQLSSMQFLKSYSFFRFGQSADNIKCSVRASATSYAPTKSVYSNSENPVYYEEKYTVLGVPTGIIKKTHKKDELKYVYKVKNARHLYNVRYLEDLPEIKTDPIDKYLSDTNKSISFKLCSDVDWAAFSASGGLRSSESVSLFNSGVLDINNAEFPSIKTIRSRDSLEGARINGMGVDLGGTYVISGLTMTENANTGYRVNRDVATDTLKTEVPLGMILINQGTLKDLQLKNVTVSGNGNVGAFAGINLSGKDCEVKGLTVGESGDASLISGDRNVGGAIGLEMTSAQSGASEYLISDITNTAQVKGRFGVGGVVGVVRNGFDTATLPAGLGDYLSPAQCQAIMDDDFSRIKLEGCENTGIVEPVNEVGASPASLAELGSTIADEKERQTARYIGGIAGYAYNKTAPTENSAGNFESRIVIENCTSSPQYESIGDLGKRLSGVYVGGIAGFNRYGIITGCRTEVTGKNSGYVLGYKYVGGIVGMNLGPAKGTVIDGKDSVNTNNVIGAYYVGGISGVNSLTQERLSDQTEGEENSGTPAGDLDPEKIGDELILLPKKAREPGTSVEKWTNRGVVIATREYAGGITGYNTGRIYSCNSDIDPDDAHSVLALVSEGRELGDYVGGIAGYNNGIIGNTRRDSDGNKVSSYDPGKTLKAQVCVTGKNYVGGIVGYNAVDAIVEDYQVAGGYVYGAKDGYFTGGYAGLNVSLALLMDRETQSSGTDLELVTKKGTETVSVKYAPHRVYSNPNEITGGYFVGGNVGGNLVNLKGDEAKAIRGLFETNNFLGQIRDTTAFVGGFIGYNVLLNMDDKDFEGLPEKLVEKMEEADSGSLTDRLEKKSALLKDLTLLDHDKVKYSDCRMVIMGEDHTSLTSSSLGKIISQVYVGGVIGYNDSHTVLYLKNVKNATPVEALSAIKNDDEQAGRDKDYAGDAKEYVYSYAGGIVGKIEEETVLDSCTNVSTGVVTTRGTYTGALAELSEGLVVNCEAGDFGSATFDYVGGLVGLNGVDGIIKDCKYEGKTVTGRNVVGGIAAENAGLIEKIDFKKPAINAVAGGSDKDGVTGLLTAVNTKTGVIRLEKDIENVKVSSKGRYVGGVCGVNQGILVNAKDIDNISDDEDKYIKVTGSISGYKDVGGLMGRNESETGSYTYDGNTQYATDTAWFKNTASVTATHGNAGGIVGYNAAENEIKNCVNTGTVSATNEGNAGGITAENFSVIEECLDTGKVKAAEGLCGGIVAVNRYDEDDDEPGEINSCKVWSPEYDDEITYLPDDFPEDDLLKFESKEAAGGICGENYGTIEDCELRYVKVINFTNSNRNSAVGMYAGRNEKHGKIILCDGRKNTEGCIARTWVNRSFVGGITGVNRGSVEGHADADGVPTSVVFVDVGFSRSGTGMANLGGAAGWNKNEGVIKNVAIAGVVTGDMGDTDIGYGGIAGMNGQVSENKVNGDQVASIVGCSFDGTLKAEGSGASIARVGGIAGINGYGAKIDSCLLGVLTDDGVNYVRDDKGKAQSSGESLTKIYAGNVEYDKNNLTAAAAQAGYKIGDLIPDPKTDNYNANTIFAVKKINTSADEGSYAYVGGMAGDNYGSIISCDNERKASDHSEGLSTDRVEVTAFKCMIGGIAGRCLEGSSVKGKKDDPVSTGRKWVVTARDCDNNLGAGGIIGVYSSGNALEYLDNYADVYCTYKTNTMAAGVVGYVNQTESPTTRVKNCTNNGSIVVYRRAGGLIADVQMSSVEMEDCVNYGQVRSLGWKAAGLIQYIYNATTPTYVRRCANHGRIIGPSAYGFLNEMNNKVYHVNCVNTGNIYGLGQNSGTNLTCESTGNVGFSEKSSYYDNCRDYANGNNFSFSGSSNLRMYRCLKSNSLKPYTKTVPDLSPLANNYTASQTKTNFYIGTDADSGTGSTDESVLKSEKKLELVQKNGTNVTLIPQNSADRFEGIKLEYSNPFGTDYLNDVASHVTGYNSDNKPTYSYHLNQEHLYRREYDTDQEGTESEWKDSGRIALYKELDPKYEEFVLSALDRKDEALATPTNIKREYDDTGRYLLKWDSVDDAAGYEAFMEITVNTPSGNVVIRSDVHTVYSGESQNSANPQCYFSGEEIRNLLAAAGIEWDGIVPIRFYVRALSGYHILHADTFDASHADDDGESCLPGTDVAYSCHSKWGWKDLDAPREIPEPKVHMEMIKGNKLVWILDNPEDYASFDEGYFNIKVEWPSSAFWVNGKATNNITFPVEDGYSKPIELYATSTHFNSNIDNIKASAEPTQLAKKNGYNDYKRSTYYTTYGGVIDTKMHESEYYFYAASFAGLKGSSGDDLSFDVKLMVRNADFYTNTELVSPAPSGSALAGVPIAYAHGWVHTANRNGDRNTHFNMNLTDLPSDLTDRDFEVRTYIYKSQNSYELMGHDVDSGVTIKSKADLAAIKDPYYFNASGQRDPEHPVYSGGKLNPGYVLYKNDDGTYDIYYNASLECREDANARKYYQVQSILYKHTVDGYEVHSNAVRGENDYTYDDATPLVHKTPIELQKYYSKGVGKTRDIYFNLEGEQTDHEYEYVFKVYNEGFAHTPENVVKTIVYRTGDFYLHNGEGNLYGKPGDQPETAKMRDTSYTNGQKYDPGTLNGVGVRAYCYANGGDNYKYGMYFKGILDNCADFDKNYIWFYDGGVNFRYVHNSTENAYDVDLDVTEVDGSIRRIQPEPSISENYIRGTDVDGHDTYTFFWDQKEDMESEEYKDAKYSVQIYGMPVGTDEWVTITNSIDTNTERSYTFTDSEDNWNYSMLKLEVTRLGVTGPGGYLTTLPKTGMRDDFRVNLKLSRPSLHNVSLYTGADGRFMTDDLNYEVVWDKITDEYETADLWGYVIMVRDKDDEEAAVHYYPISVSGNGSIPKASDYADGVIVSDQVRSVDADYAEGQYMAVINLADFTGEHELAVSVRALARADASIYSDGNYSVEMPFKLLRRLATPVITNDTEGKKVYTGDDGMRLYADAATTYEDNSEAFEHAVTSEEYKKGITVKVDNSEVYPDAPRLHIAAAVFDEPLADEAVDADDSGAGKSLDRFANGDGDETGYWNYGAKAVLLPKADMTVMSGTAQDASFHFDMAEFEEYTGQYAGKWIKLAFMAKKTNEINSNWTDEDVAGETVDYYWIHIPRLLLDDIVPGDSLDLGGVSPLEKYYYYNGTENVIYSSKPESGEYGVFKQVAMGFDTDVKADAYSVIMKQKAYSDGEGGTIQPTYGLYLCRNDSRGGMDVYMKTLSEVTKDIEERSRVVGDEYEDAEGEFIPECSIKGSAVWIGYLAGYKEGEENGEQVIDLSDVFYPWTLSQVKFEAELRFTADPEGGSLRLILPDLQSNDIETDRVSYLLTEGILIQPRYEDTSSTENVYCGGRRVLWYRDMETVDRISRYKYLSKDEADSWLKEIGRLTDQDNLVGDSSGAPEFDPDVEIEEEGNVAEEEVSGAEDTETASDEENGGLDVGDETEANTESGEVVDDDAGDDQKADESEESDKEDGGQDSENKESENKDSENKEADKKESENSDSEKKDSDKQEADKEGSERKSPENRDKEEKDS